MKDNKGRPTTGTLWYNGKVLKENLPFYILQAEKKNLIATGYYKKDLFKITYYHGKN